SVRGGVLLERRGERAQPSAESPVDRDVSERRAPGVRRIERGRRAAPRVIRAQDDDGRRDLDPRGDGAGHRARLDVPGLRNDRAQRGLAPRRPGQELPHLGLETVATALVEGPGHGGEPDGHEVSLSARRKSSGSLASLGMTFARAWSRRATRSQLTMTVASALLSPTCALIVATPAFTPDAIPAASTGATDGSDEL